MWKLSLAIMLVVYTAEVQMCISTDYEECDLACRVQLRNIEPSIILLHNERFSCAAQLVDKMWVIADSDCMSRLADEDKRLGEGDNIVVRLRHNQQQRVVEIVKFHNGPPAPDQNNISIVKVRDSFDLASLSLTKAQLSEMIPLHYKSWIKDTIRGYNGFLSALLRGGVY